MAEQISIPILTPGANESARNIKQVGDAAAGTGLKLDFAAASLKAFNDASAKSARADQSSIAALRAHTKASSLLADAENVLAGRATTTTKLFADQGRELDKTGNAAEAAAGTGGSGGLSALIGGGAGGGMTGLIAAGVALSPVILSVGTGLLGLGAAAYGTAKPIINAAQATGGLQANMAKLNPEQRKVAQGLLGLGQQFGAFQKQMQPAVFTIFNKSLGLAGTLLHGIEPVAMATGKALGTVLGNIDREFRSGTWTGFFTFMAKTAGPDVKLLGDLFVNLLDALPPLVEELQPMAIGLLHVADAAARVSTILTHTPQLIGDTAGALSALQTHQVATGKSSDTMGAALYQAGLRTQVASPIVSLFSQTVRGAGGAFRALTGQTGTAVKGLQGAGHAVLTAGPKFFSLNAAVAALNTSMTTLVGNLLTLQGGELSWKQSLQAAQTQLKSNTAGLEGNSKNALANKQAVLASTNAAISFASQELTTGKNIAGASRTVQSQISWLQGLHDKSQFVKDELHALRLEEQKLQAQRINQTINVQGLGQWSVSQSLAPGAGHRRAMGGLIPGTGSRDSYPALLTPGEVVVPTRMVGAGAVDHLRGKLPGFAAGGLVPSYSGSPAMAGWVKADDKATINLIDAAVVKATLAGMRAASRAASLLHPTGSGGSVQALMKSMAASIGWTGALWTDLFNVENAEAGFSLTAQNPTSRAYGLAQFINGPSEYYQWGGNPNTATGQITGMLNYIRANYGTPAGAWNSELTRGFYDKGGWLPPGRSVAYNGTGRPEMVIPAGGGGRQEIVLRIETNDSETTRFLVRLLAKHVRTAGGGNVQLALGRP